MDQTTTASPSTPLEEHRHAPANPKRDPAMPVRLADLEPYVGLGYLSKLFKLMAIILLLLLVSEIITARYPGHGVDPDAARRDESTHCAGRPAVGQRRPRAPPHRHGTRCAGDQDSPRQAGAAPNRFDRDHPSVRLAARGRWQLRGAWPPLSFSRSGIRPGRSSSSWGCLREKARHISSMCAPFQHR